MSLLLLFRGGGAPPVASAQSGMRRLWLRQWLIDLYEEEQKGSEDVRVEPTVEAPEVVQKAVEKKKEAKPKKLRAAKTSEPRVVEVFDLTPAEVFDVFAELRELQKLPEMQYEFKAERNLKAASVAQLMEARQVYLDELTMVRESLRRRRAAAAIILLAA